MSVEHKFPDLQPIDWDALEAGDRVLIEAAVRTHYYKHSGNIEKQIVHGAVFGAYIFAREGDPISGHVIKAPKPLAVGDTVRTDAIDVYEVLALFDDKVWLRHARKLAYYKTAYLADVVRVEE
jgi:hypothetical protein